MKTEYQHRRDLIEIGKRIHQHGWISATDGNFSVKLGDGRILTTPTGVHKGYLEMEDLIIVDMEGKKISGSREPSSEIALHVICYKQRPEINAVIHAHPTFCVAFSVAGVGLAACLLPEVVFTLGSIPTADYAPPTTLQVPKSIELPIKEYDAIILERHGSVTVGKDIFSAYNTLERMEHVAEITYHARQLGSVKPLTDVQVSELVKIRSGLGLPDRKVGCNDCNACNKHSMCGNAKGEKPAPTMAAEPPVRRSIMPNVSPELLELITREVAREMSAAK
ncbi:MAG: class II aldolase/adducin family protein [Nitrospinae bacterium]|nr:class II aldolase/adducin family protein [Nitrospinota bacterium]